jgi:hypothetical protein
VRVPRGSLRLAGIWTWAAFSFSQLLCGKYTFSPAPHSTPVMAAQQGAPAHTTKGSECINALLSSSHHTDWVHPPMKAPLRQHGNSTGTPAGRHAHRAVLGQQPLCLMKSLLIHHEGQGRHGSAPTMAYAAPWPSCPKSGQHWGRFPPGAIQRCICGGRWSNGDGSRGCPGSSG